PGTSPLSLHDALPIWRTAQEQGPSACGGWEREAAPLAVYSRTQAPREGGPAVPAASAVGAVFTHPSPTRRGAGGAGSQCLRLRVDRKSTRLNSSHVSI